MFLEMRLEKYLYLRDAKYRVHEKGEVVEMITRLLKLRTYKSLMVGVHRELGNFFKFEEMGILFYDKAMDKLFTLHIEEELIKKQP